MSSCRSYSTRAIATKVGYDQNVHARISILGTMKKDPASFHRLDSALKEFYDHHKVDISALLLAGAGRSNNNATLSANPFRYRFVRLNPRFNVVDTLCLLKEELNDGTDPIHVSWLPDDSFYALPADFALSDSTCFRSGRLYGMDVSSGAAVSVLLSDRYDKPSHSAPCNAKEDGRELPGVRVLDLCCCPGLKLCAIADRVPAGSTVIGVDISERRMALCSKIVRKYHIENSTSGCHQDNPASSVSSTHVKIQLYCQDGTTFGSSGLGYNLVFDSRVALEEEETRGSRKRKNKSARAREQKRLKQIAAKEFLVPAGVQDDGPTTNYVAEDTSTAECTNSIQTGPSCPLMLFDRVLVDAECSTDGSLKHLRECLKEATESSSLHTTNSLLTDQDKLADLLDLQRGLISSGYRLLKHGGALVYSTCSLSQDQNENIVQWLLDQCPDAYLIPVEFPLSKSSKFVVDGSVGGTIRFYPNLSRDPGVLLGDGFFVAKIGKRAQKVEQHRTDLV